MEFEAKVHVSINNTKAKAPYINYYTVTKKDEEMTIHLYNEIKRFINGMKKALSTGAKAS
jgi:hypothetical protein